MSGYKALIGKMAPSFKLKNHDGQDYDVRPGETSLPLVIFFYPESGQRTIEAFGVDGTHFDGGWCAGSFGCTRQACQFRDAVAEKPKFSPEKVQIIGVSPDPVEKQKAFVEKEKLTYQVLSDESKDIFQLYGIGRGMWGLVQVARVTFVVDQKGIVRDALEGTMNYGAHAKFVEDWLEILESGAEAPEAAKVVAESPLLDAEGAKG